MTDLAAANLAIRDLYAAIGTRLRTAREQRGVTQADLANALGLTRASVTNIEAGNQRIQVHTLVAAAQALGITTADLVSASSRGVVLASVAPSSTGVVRARLLAAREEINAALRSMPRAGSGGQS